MVSVFEVTLRLGSRVDGRYGARDHMGGQLAEFLRSQVPFLGSDGSHQDSRRDRGKKDQIAKHVHLLGKGDWVSNSVPVTVTVPVCSPNWARAGARARSRNWAD
jgi:hypothetical protein